MSIERRRSGQVRGVGVDDVVKALKIHLNLESVLASPSKSLFANEPAEEALRKHHKLVDYLEELTGNPRKTLLQSALKELNRWAGGRLGDDDEEEWSRKESYALKQLFIHVREKSHRYTTGVRTDPEVLRLLQRHRQRQMQGRMLRGTRRLLHRRHSDSVEPPAAHPALQAPQLELPSGPAAATLEPAMGSTTCLPSAAATSPPARRPRTSGAASSSTRQKPLSRSAIFALYGAVPPNDSEVLTVESSAELLGSQDDVVEVSHDPSPAKPRAHKTYYDAHLDRVVRAYVDGSLEYGATQKGPRGFLVAHFPDGATWESEIPNLTLELTQEPPQPPAKRRRGKGKPQEASHEQGLPPPAQGSGPSADSASSAAAPPLFRITRATAQTYICRQEGKKWPLVIAVSAKQTSAHQAVGEALYAHVQANPYTKPQLLALRDTLIQQHSPAS